MQENAIYSVISPEGCAAILWRDAGEAKKAAAAFKPDAAHCLELGVIDGIVPEPRGRRAHRPRRGGAAARGRAREALDELDGRPGRRAAPRRRRASSARWAFSPRARDRFSSFPQDPQACPQLSTGFIPGRIPSGEG